MVADFTWSCRACSGVFRLWGSCRGLVVLGSCFSGVQHPLGAGAAIWVTENLRGSSLHQPNSKGRPENVSGSLHSLAKLVAAFLGFRGSYRELAVLCSSSVRVRLPPRAGAASWAAETPRGSSPGQPNSEGRPENVGGTFHSLAELVAAFLGCRGSSRGLVVLSSYSVGVGHPPTSGGLGG